MAHVQTINHLSLTIDHCVLRAHKFPFPCKENNIPTHTEQMVQTYRTNGTKNRGSSERSHGSYK